MMLARAEFLNKFLDGHLYFDAFAGCMICRGIDADWGYFPDGRWADVHTFSLRRALGRYDVTWGKARDLRSWLAHYAAQHTINTAAERYKRYAKNWDHKSRVDGALESYWRITESTRGPVEHHSRNLFLSIAAHALSAACAAMPCPVFLGSTYAKKTMALQALIGNEWFSEGYITLGPRGAAKLQGKLMWDLVYAAPAATDQHNMPRKLSAFTRAKSDGDQYRQTCFVITTTDIVLAARLESPHFPTLRVSQTIDVDGIKRDREQLLGEAAARVLDLGEWCKTHSQELGVEDTRMYPS